jgi:hypothetical protein
MQIIRLSIQTKSILATCSQLNHDTLINSFLHLILELKISHKYCDVHAVDNMACVDNRCYGNG